jgi:hypothetical protein
MFDLSLTLALTPNVNWALIFNCKIMHPLLVVKYLL